MGSAFYNCKKLTNFPKFNTSSATDLEYTWYHCESLTSFPEIEINATSLSGAWSYCISL